MSRRRRVVVDINWVDGVRTETTCTSLTMTSRVYVERWHDRRPIWHWHYMSVIRVQSGRDWPEVVVRHISVIGTRIQTAPRGTYTIGDMSGYELVVFMIILGSLVDTACYNREITVILELSVKKQICQATITKNFGTLEFRLNIAILTVTLSTVLQTFLILNSDYSKNIGLLKQLLKTGVYSLASWATTCKR